MMKSEGVIYSGLIWIWAGVSPCSRPSIPLVDLAEADTMTVDKG